MSKHGRPPNPGNVSDELHGAANAEWEFDYSPGPSEQVLTNTLPVPSPRFARDLETAFATASDDHPVAKAA
jgi:hypothetical protein